MKYFSLFLSVLAAVYYFTSPHWHADGDTKSLASAESTPNYLKQIQPLFDNRCVACHSCYNSPCQLNLASYEGLERGFHPTARVYDMRNKSIAPTRLFTDAQTAEEWRKIGFHSIVSPENGDILRKVLDPNFNPSSGKELAKAEESRVCYKNSQLVSRMPYGLPPLNDNETALIHQWLDAGSPGPTPEDLAAQEQPSPQNRAAVESWEEYFNRKPLKQRVIARYIYEHLYLGRLYFEQPNEFFVLIRSSQPCRQDGQITMKEIATRRPYDSPGENFYYCLRKSVETRVHKTHMTYQLSAAKMKRFTELFESSEYGEWQNLSEMPSYKIDTAANPFVSFAAIPVKARYRFLLDNAQYFVMNFIRGPVCKGNTALNVINEQFHVIFVDPDAYATEALQNFVNGNAKLLNPPAVRGSDFGVRGGKVEAESQGVGSILKMLGTLDAGAAEALTFMGGVSSLPKAIWQLHRNDPPSGLLGDRIQYRLNRAKFYASQLKDGYNPDHIWDGDGQNDNALLTIFRHYDSATVLKGAVGPLAKTVWVVDYALLESIFYNLVSGFDVFGDIGHHLSTRYYKSQQRLDGEEHFLYFVPPQYREALRNSWYRDGKGLQARFFSVEKRMAKWYPISTLAHGPGVLPGDHRTGSRPSMETLNEIKKAVFQKIYDQRLSKIYGAYPPPENVFGELAEAKAGYSVFFPDSSLVRVRSSNGDKVYSLIHDKEYFNVAFIFFEDKRRDKANDSLYAVEGFVGSYPMQFFDIEESQVSAFIRQVKSVSSAQAYQKLVETFGITRESEAFWPFYDFLNEYMRQTMPVEAGLLDLNRYGNMYE